jgi:hypothetical protein
MVPCILLWGGVLWYAANLLKLFVLLLLLLLPPVRYMLLILQPENLEKQGRVLPRAVRAWPPRDNGKYDTIGQLPPIIQLPQAALPVAAAALSSS